MLQPYKWNPSLSPNTIRPSLEAYSEVHCMSESKQDWRKWGILNFTDSKSGESKAYWIWRQQVRLEEMRYTQSEREQDWSEAHWMWQSIQNWRNWGIMNLTDSKQDWRKWGTLNFTKSQCNLNIWGILNLTENMGRETEAYWNWHSKQDWRNWGVLHLTCRLFTTNTHKATLGSDGPRKMYYLPLS